MKLTSSLTTLLSFVGLVIGQVYNPVRDYSGSTFFDRWSYYGSIDNLTWGNVTWVDQATATASNLAYVNSAGNAMILVDNTTTILPPPPSTVINRNAVRLTSIDLYPLGSLIMIDALHIPYGCSVWPSFWTLGPQTTWPGSGEIDIIEGINGMENNQVAVHTPRGCTQPAVTTQSGTTTNVDCSSSSGCLVRENQANSYGKSFAKAGGGVFALQLEASGINIWFFSRPDIPANIQQATTSSQIDTSTWGIPTANYPNTTCDIQKHFPPQELILLTTLCGVWAGVPAFYQSSCKSPTGSCVADNVIGNGSNYLNAYWEIKYIRAYLNEDMPLPTSSASSPSVATSTSTSAHSTQSAASTDTANSASFIQSSILSWVFSLLLISVIGQCLL